MEHDPDIDAKYEHQREANLMARIMLEERKLKLAREAEEAAKVKYEALIDRILATQGPVFGWAIIFTGIGLYYVKRYALDFLALLAVFAVAYMALVATAGAQTPDTWWIDALRDKNVSEATINAIIEELYRAGSEIESLDERLAECEQAVIIEKYRNK